MRRVTELHFTSGNRETLLHASVDTVGSGGHTFPALRARVLRAKSPAGWHEPRSPQADREAFMTDWGRDARIAWRTIWRSPGVAVFIVALLALGIGGSGGLLALLETVMLRPVPSPYADRLALIEVVSAQGVHRLMPLRTLAELERQQDAFDAMSGYTGHLVMPAMIDGRVLDTSVALTSGNYFQMLGVTPRFGRLLTRADNEDNAGDATIPVVLGHRFWTEEFGADPDVVGRTFDLDAVPVTVVGIARPEYRGVAVERETDITITMNGYGRVVGVIDPRVGVRANYIIARLSPGVSLEQAETRLETAWPAARDLGAPPLTPRELEDFAGQTLELSGFRTGFSIYRTRYGDALTILLWLLAALVVLISANLAGLLAARYARRSDEWRVCRALGARGWDLLRLSLTESALYVLLGILAALPIAWSGSHGLLLALWPGRDAPGFVAMPGTWTVAILAGAAAATTIVMSVLPARLAAHVGRAPLAAPATVVGRPRKLVRTLVVGQLALSLVVIFLAAVLGRNLTQWWSVDPGYDPDSVVLAELNQQPGVEVDPEVRTYLPPLVNALRALPGVESAGLSTSLAVYSLTVGRPADLFTPESGDTALFGVYRDRVSPGLLETLRVPLVAGRDFTWDDDVNHPLVAIVTKNVAEAITPEGAVGRRIRVATEPADREIVGVVPNIGTLDLRMRNPRMVFSPILQEPRFGRLPVAMLRTSAGFDVNGLRDTVRSNGRHYVMGLTSIRARTGLIMMAERMTASLGAVFSALALVIAVTGLASLLASVVESRRREFGVRLALGASRGALVRSVTLECGLLTAGGIAVGIPAALAAGRFTSAVLLNVRPTDPGALAFAVAALAVAGLAAGLAPALLAARTDPLVALKAE